MTDPLQEAIAEAQWGIDTLGCTWDEASDDSQFSYLHDAAALLADPAVRAALRAEKRKVWDEAHAACRGDYDIVGRPGSRSRNPYAEPETTP